MQKKTHCSIFKIMEMGNFLKFPKISIFFFKNSLSVHIRQKCLRTRCFFYILHPMLILGTVASLIIFFDRFCLLKSVDGPRPLTVVSVNSLMREILSWNRRGLASRNGNGEDHMLKEVLGNFAKWKFCL